jgi:hypothetical protein
MKIIMVENKIVIGVKLDSNLFSVIYNKQTSTVSNAKEPPGLKRVNRNGPSQNTQNKAVTRKACLRDIPLACKNKMVNIVTKKAEKVFIIKAASINVTPDRLDQVASSIGYNSRVAKGYAPLNSLKEPDLNCKAIL